MPISFEGAHFPKEIILTVCAGMWRFLRKRPVWVGWRLNETYIRVKGEWVSL